MERNIRLDWPELVKEAVKRRKQQGLTQKQFAVLVDVSGPTVNSFEQGKTSITLESCFKILRFLGLIEEDLGLFEQALPAHKKINDYFINLKNSGNYIEPIEDAFNRCQPYLDGDFKKLFPLENDFFPRLWELFICNTLVHSEAENYLNRTHGKGPDFLLKDFYEGKNVYIECVCPQGADPEKGGSSIKNESYKRSEQKKSDGSFEIISSRSEGSDERIVSRYTSSLLDKSKKFTESYHYTQGHYRILCISGVVLGLLKAKWHNSANNRVSTQEDFEVAIRGKREHFFDKGGNHGFKDTVVEIPKGSTTIPAGYQDYLQTFDAIIFCDLLPFSPSTSGDVFKIWFKEGVSNDFEKSIRSIFQHPEQ